VADKTWEVYKKLDDRGIDVFKGVTQLNVVPAPVGASYKQPTNGEELINKIIYLPIHRDVPFKHIKQICEDVTSVINRSKL
jgi:dTDP-4-amino-4,6-dideoxygalactose transaminase